MALTLNQFSTGKTLGLPNPSPFCMKLETYLRLAGLPYTVHTLRGRPGSATGKAPYIHLDGKISRTRLSSSSIWSAPAGMRSMVG